MFFVKTGAIFVCLMIIISWRIFCCSLCVLVCFTALNNAVYCLESLVFVSYVNSS